MSITEQEIDKTALALFKAEMGAKLKAKREEGRGGWRDPDQCSIAHLENLLIAHVPKRDWIDVANFCMMLWNREKEPGWLKDQMGDELFYLQNS